MYIDPKKLKDPISRQRFVQGLAGLTMGVSAGMGLPVSANEASPKGRKKIVRVFLQGGMSHLDTFDPKPQSPELMGDTKTIPTNTGETISAYLPKMAQRMDKIALIRSMSSAEGDHSRGRYLFETSYAPIGTIRHPFMGAWMQKLNGQMNETLPASVNIHSKYNSGFMGAEFDPFVINNPSNALSGLIMKEPESEENLEWLRLSTDLRKKFHQKYDNDKVKAYAQFYNQSIRLMHSDDLVAFDINKEDTETKRKYSSRHGKSFLLARRLIEADVQYVSMQIGGWDTHEGMWRDNSFENKVKEVDDGLATFIDDLYERGLYEDTIISVHSEFGRTPKINSRIGRDHHRKAFFALLAGAGVKLGSVYGKSDDQGMSVVENPVSPQDFNATLAQLAGLNLQQEIYSPDNRPFTIARDGKPVTGVLV